MKAKHGHLFGFTAILGAVIFSLALTGCGSAPNPVGDPGEVRDVLAGKSFGGMRAINKLFLTFNFDGSVTMKQLVYGFMPVSNTGTYTVSGRTATFVLDRSYPISLNSATDPTEIVMEGTTLKKQ